MAYRKGDLRDKDRLKRFSGNQRRREFAEQPTGKVTTVIQTAYYILEETTRLQTTSLQPGGIDLRDTDSLTSD